MYLCSSMKIPLPIYFVDRHCGVVVRGPGSITGATRFSEK
jgi:hypothetical protein